ncbi:MAG TPA: 50S ribosomal protein L9 [Candidatus Paceibacterota bacterium]|nr:50S ribosomal protein L9 [Candidatus Paceibacterota bacterium]
MKVILLKSVAKVGKKDEVVDVAVGYAEHALFPKKLAIPATESAIALLKKREQQARSEKVVRHALLDKAIAVLTDREIIMPVRANAQGHLFSKVHVHDIARFLEDTYRIAIDVHCLKLPKEGSLKVLGRFPIEIVDDHYHASFILTLARE